MSRFFIVFVLFLSLENHAFGKTPQRFILALECSSISSYARFDGETFRGLMFESKELARKGVDFKLESSSLLSALKDLSLHSRQRADQYRRDAKRIVSLFQAVPPRSLRPDPYRLRDINRPEGCELLVVAVLQVDAFGEFIAGYLDNATWGRLSFLDQKLLWLEIFSAIETMDQLNEWGSRLFAEAVLAKNSGFDQDKKRFELLKELGFSYAETKDFNGLCWDLKQPVKWIAELPMAGFGWSDFRFSNLCKGSWRGQVMHLSGFFKLNASGAPTGFEFLSVWPLRKDDKSFYRDAKLSQKYKTDLVFIGGAMASEMPIEFYKSGELKFGYVFSDIRLQMNFSNHHIQVGLQKIGAIETWQDSPVAFWQNGNPRRIGRAFGEVTIRGRSYELVSDQIYFFENGALECADFKPGTEFESRDYLKFRVSQENRYTCFDREGYALSSRFGFHYADKSTIESYYPFQGDPGYVLPQRAEFRIN